MAGFWTRYFSTVFKGIQVLSFKERIEIRRVVNHLKHADRVLYKSIFDNVEKRHRVTRALNQEETLQKDLQISAENAYRLIFNVTAEDLKLEEVIHKILQELENLSKSVHSLPKSSTSVQAKKVLGDLAETILRALRGAEAEERKEYKQVMLVVNESENATHNKFMANVKLMFQKEDTQSLLTKFVMRREIRKAARDITQLAKIPVKIKAVRNRLTKKGKKVGVEKIIGELYGTIHEIKKFLADAFHELFLLKKRDVLLVLKILFDINNLRQFNSRWTEKSFMPRASIEEKNKKLFELERKVYKDFLPIAQGFRIVISRLNNLEKELERDIAQLR